MGDFWKVRILTFTSLNRAQMKQNLSFPPEGEDGICLLQSFAQISARVQVDRF